MAQRTYPHSPSSQSTDPYSARSVSVLFALHIFDKQPAASCSLACKLFQEAPWHPLQGPWQGYVISLQAGPLGLNVPDRRVCQTVKTRSPSAVRRSLVADVFFQPSPLEFSQTFGSCTLPGMLHAQVKQLNLSQDRCKETIAERTLLLLRLLEQASRVSRALRAVELLILNTL